MSVVMFIVGAVAAVIGVVLAAAGIPVKEFSFGNTLIIAGSVAILGGLIVFALGAVIAQLQRIADMLGARPATRSARALEPFEQSDVRPGQGPGRIPFPPKPKVAPQEYRDAEPRDAEPPFAATTDHDDRHSAPAEPGFAPALRNPDEPAYADSNVNEAPLMPRQAPSVAAESMRPPSPHNYNGSGTAPERPASPGIGWRPSAPPPPPRPQPSYFDAMWPSEQNPAKPDNPGEKPARVEPPMRESVMREPPKRDLPKRDLPTHESLMREPAEAKRAEAATSSSVPPPLPAPSVSDLRVVPILKSGVIDGMGYTLYVDGSIEAELPHGTLRFASIGELREHLDRGA